MHCFIGQHLTTIQASYTSDESKQFNINYTTQNISCCKTDRVVAPYSYCHRVATAKMYEVLLQIFLLHGLIDYRL